MNRLDTVSDDYFDWMCDIIHEGSYRDGYSYQKLLSYLFEKDFTFDEKLDKNRAVDGVNLRYQHDPITPDILRDKPCSVLEMMIALCIRCESIMEDAEHDDRTDYWFWIMITNLGLNDMSDDRFNIRMVRNRVGIFLRREYKKDGQGGLFVIPHCVFDLTAIDIWYQMHWFIRSIT